MQALQLGVTGFSLSPPDRGVSIGSVSMIEQIYQDVGSPWNMRLSSTGLNRHQPAYHDSKQGAER
jgi:hypothetical protein